MRGGYHFVSIVFKGKNKMCLCVVELHFCIVRPRLIELDFNDLIFCK